MRAISTLRKVVRMPARELRLLFAAAVALPLVWGGLRWYGLAPLRTKLKGKPVDSWADVNLEHLRRMGQLVNRIGRFELGVDSCLSASVVFDWLCRRRGIASQLCIGVRFVERRLEAHAWVEWDGTPINDRDDIARNFAPFPHLPPLAAFVRR